MGNWPPAETINRNDLIEFCAQPLPWDHINTGIDKNWLSKINEYDLSFENRCLNIVKKANNEFSIVKSLTKNLNNKDHLFIGNSSVVRSFNKFSGILKKQVNIFTNRGASGIDGIISTSLGLSFINKKSKNFLVIGDISFFHDINGLMFYNLFLQT